MLPCNLGLLRGFGGLRHRLARLPGLGLESEDTLPGTQRARRVAQALVPAGQPGGLIRFTFGQGSNGIAVLDEGTGYPRLLSLRPVKRGQAQIGTGIGGALPRGELESLLGGCELSLT